MATIPKKKALRTISKELKSIDFKSFNILKDKPILMHTIQAINSRLGKLLRELE